MFESAFEPVEGGYLYYPWVWGRGQLITEAEKQIAREQYLSVTRGRFILRLMAYMFSAVIVLTIADLTFDAGDDFKWWFSILIWVPPVAFMLWKTFAAQRIVWGRKPIAPRRSLSEHDRHASKASNWYLLAFSLAALIVWLAVGGVLLIQGNWWGALVLAVGLFGLLRTVRTIYYKVVDS